jgi:ABC-type branched-subunit amino acid transport system ATPase component
VSIELLDSGKVLMQGTPDEVRSNKEVIEAYLGNDSTSQAVGSGAS